MVLHLTEPWWKTDDYVREDLFPEQLSEFAGPRGLATVRVFPDGRTDSGWGLTHKRGDAFAFAAMYKRGAFNLDLIEEGYDQGKHAVALVMRSVRLIAFDIDGKNGGLEHAEEILAGAPPTLAETSKSGSGYHLFYAVPDEWSDAEGFGKFADFIGIVQGVDIRSVGCVYHHPQQRWNDREIAELPQYIVEKLERRKLDRSARTTHIKKTLETQDEVEILLMHEELIAELEKDIPDGKRNNTLFAIGTKMLLAEVPDWESRINKRALDVGLDSDEINRLIENVTKYANA